MNEINVLVNFLIFYPDNYQGGSGKHFMQSKIVSLNPFLNLREIKDEVSEEIRKLTADQTHNWDDSEFVIKEIQII